MSDRRKSTLAELLKEKPRRGRPSRSVSRKSVYVALSPERKKQVDELAGELPESLSRADIPDMAITLLTYRMELLRRDVADRDREIPEGVTDLESLYLLWDLPLSPKNELTAWTSIRLSPQQVIELGRIHGVLKAMFGVNRSQVYSLSLTLFEEFLHQDLAGKSFTSLSEFNTWMRRIYL